MKKIIFILALSYVLISILTTQTASYKQNLIIGDLRQDSIQVKSYTVTATMYYPVASQCDSDPFLTAGMFKIKPNKASEHKWIAMSRDLIERWGGEFAYGDYVEIKGTGKKDGIYRVVDTMNRRFKNRIDFLETVGTKPYKFDNVTLTKIDQWKQKEVLASL